MAVVIVEMDPTRESALVNAVSDSSDVLRAPVSILGRSVMDGAIVRMGRMRRLVIHLAANAQATSLVVMASVYLLLPNVTAS